MTAEKMKKAYLAAAVAAGGITGAIVFYTVIAEAFRVMGHKPPLAPPAAYAVKYALYIIGLSALAVLKFSAGKFAEKKATPEETVKALTVQAMVKAGVCELPAVCGLIMFLLTGYRLDFYLLVIFSLGLEVYHFPRLALWEERLRGDFGQL